MAVRLVTDQLLKVESEAGRLDVELSFGDQRYNVVVGLRVPMFTEHHRPILIGTGLG